MPLNRSVVLATIAAVTLVVAAIPAFGATFFVPTDRALIRRADAIVTATAVASHVQRNALGGIETITTFTAEEALKGDPGATFIVAEPGGEHGGQALAIAGVPRFNNGERVLLFLARTGPDRWSVAELAVGKFSYRRTGRGSTLLVRDASEIHGWNPDLTAHREEPRAAAPFLEFIRRESRGAGGEENYFVNEPAFTASTESTALLPPTTNVAPFTATSYTMSVSGSLGSRWTAFPNSVTFFSGTTQEPGAPGGGTTAVTTAIAAWNNDCLSNVNYVYGGTDNGTHTQGLHAADGANTVLFERDLSAWGVAPFSCSSTGYSGTLGLGGITSASGTNVVNGETFMNTLEADVEMNRGIANCTLLFNNGDFNSAVTHEMGHTLGFRHSDQNRASSAACTTDPSLECSNQAIMKSFIPTGLSAALQTWDQHAVDAVYPGNVCSPSAPPPPPTCTAPSITAQPQSISTNGSTFVTLSVSASGTATLTYQWYFGSAPNTAILVPGGTGPSVQVSPAATTQYWVRISNGCGSVNSATATVTFTGGSAGNPALLLSTGSTSWHLVGAGDFTGDGNADIVVQNFDSRDIYLWVMQGTTVVSSSTFIGRTSSTDWQIRAIGDFDKNGTPDLVVQSQSTGSIYVWTMSGTTVLNPNNFVRTVSSLEWKVVAAADFNGDGFVDLMLQSTATRQIVVWTMRNFTVLNTDNLLGTSASGFTARAAADFDGNGYADVVLRNSATGQNALWYTTALTVTSTSNLFPTLAGSSWQIVTAVDFDHDGVPDLLWNNTSTRETAIWLIRGLALK